MSLWIWDNEVDEACAKRALKLNFRNLDLDESASSPHAEFVSDHTGELYDTTLFSCTCKDFLIGQRKRPCKHIVRLGMECGLLNKNGKTVVQQQGHELANLMAHIALCAGYYYVFDNPIVSDEHYDELKAQYASMVATVPKAAKDFAFGFMLNDVTVSKNSH